VADTLTAEKDSVIKFDVSASSTLSSMKIKAESFFTYFELGSKDQVQELISLGVPVLFTDKVKPNDKVNFIFASFDRFEHCFHMRSSEKLKSTNDDFDLEERVLDLQVFLNFLKYGNFFL
jgi:hypothetical protein